MEFDSLKEKFLYYRGLTDYRLSKDNYVMVMLDGRSFSKKIKKRFKRPFDEAFINIMNETAKYICEKVSGCKMAYVQSDEINLVLHTTELQEPFFANRLCKLQSIIASMATSKFNQLVLLNDVQDLPCSKEDVVDIIRNMSLFEFDCKAWSVLDANDAYASILYRQNDCVRNSKEAVAQWKFSPNELHRKTTDEQVAMLLKEHGINWWGDFNDGEKYGRFVVPKEFVKIDDNGKEIHRHKWEIMNAFLIGGVNNRKEIMKFIEDGTNDA